MQFLTLHLATLSTKLTRMHSNQGSNINAMRVLKTFPCSACKILITISTILGIAAGEEIEKNKPIILITMQNPLTRSFVTNTKEKTLFHNGNTLQGLNALSSNCSAYCEPPQLIRYQSFMIYAYENLCPSKQ